MALTNKHKIRYPVAGDSAAALATYFSDLATDVDKKLAHRALPWFGKPYIESGGAVTTPSGLLVSVTAGVAVIGGQSFDFAASGNLTLGASADSKVWLTATLDANGFITGHSWSIRTDTTVPANSVLVANPFTNASAVTSTNATFRGVIAPGALIGRVSAVASVSGVGDKHSISHVGDGVTRIRARYAGVSIANNTTGLNGGLHFRDGAGGTGTQYGGIDFHSPAANYGTNANCHSSEIPVFVGLKTIYLYLTATAGGTPTLGAAATFPTAFELFFDI